MSLPYYPLYVNDFEAGAAHLTLEEDGALNRLLRLLWRSPRCSIPNDDDWIRRKLRVDVFVYEQTVKRIIDEFLVVQNGRLISPRLSREWAKAGEKHAKAVESGRRGGQRSAEIRALKS